MAWQTVTERMTAQAAELRELIEALVSDRGPLREMEEVSGLVFIGPTRYWAELDVDRRRLQAKALDAYGGTSPSFACCSKGSRQS